jgi:DNA helicase II / ATP-dependent DNA helicase PcrA
MKVFEIFGPPGTGKTTRLLDLLDREIASGISPAQIAFVTFTKKGAENGRQRAMERFHLKKDDFPYFRTLHSMAFQELGLKRHQVISRDEYRRFSKAMGMNFLGYYTEDLTNNDDKYLFFYDVYRNNPRAAQMYIDELESDKLSYVIKGFKKFKNTFAVWDYTDMIHEFTKRNTAVPVKVAFIDEAQDLTSLQWLMVWVAFKECDRIYIGGDDDQAIYQWSGADVDYFLGIKGEQEILRKSWRLPDEVLHYAKKITNQISKRVNKEYTGTGAKGFVTHIADIGEIPIRDDETYMFLSRNNTWLKGVEEALMKKGVVYSLKGEPAVSTADMKAIRLYEDVRKERIMSTSDEYQLKPYIKDKMDLNKPWFDAFKWPSIKCDYIRDLLAKKVSIKDPKIDVGTIHSVKGGEADNVIVLADITKSVKDNLERNPDAEHRVFYVGCTRAKKRLYILQADSKYSYPIIRS